MRWFLLCIVLVVAQLCARTAYAEGAEENYQLAHTRYKNGLYEEAADILRKLLSVQIDPVAKPERALVHRKARPVFVACLFGIAAVVEEEAAKALVAEADAAILSQYLYDPFFKLASGYSQRVNDRWTRVYFEHADELDKLKDERIAAQQASSNEAAKIAALKAKRVRELEALAAEENFVETRSRVVAVIPFGAGQFQNDDIGWGVFFAVSQGLFITSSIISWGVSETIKDTRCPATQLDEDTGEFRNVDCEALFTNFEISRAVNYTSLGATGALIIIGILQAQLAFERERVITRKRPIPPPITITPNAFVSPNGGFVGVSGRF